VTDLCNGAEYSTLRYTSSSYYAIFLVMLLIVMIIFVMALILVYTTLRGLQSLTVMNSNGNIPGCLCKTDLCNEAEYSTLLYMSSSYYAIFCVMLLIAVIILVIGLIYIYTLHGPQSLTVTNIAINSVNNINFNSICAPQAPRTCRL